MTVTILTGDCRAILPTLEAGSVQTCVTSPPYWNLRDYGHADQIGSEPTVDEYVANLVRVFREVRRVLADDGTLWCNLGDSYASTPAGNSDATFSAKQASNAGSAVRRNRSTLDAGNGIKAKDLIGVPWRVAFALQADGWYLRSEIIWHKPNPMPESVTDRPTKAHEQIFLLTKSARYMYDAAAIAEPSTDPETIAGRRKRGVQSVVADQGDKAATVAFHNIPDGKAYPNRNRRSVWTVATQPYSAAHFATFPPKLIEPCILSGSRPGDTVLDPFGGSGTTGQVAEKFGRDAILIELNPAYRELIETRTAQRGLSLDVA